MSTTIKNFLFLILLFFPVISTAEENSKLIEVEFDESIGKNHHLIEYWGYFSKPYSKEHMDFLRNLYNKNKPSKKKYNDTPIIPKIIHQVWVGGQPIPPLYLYYQKTCKDLHPNWEYRLWTDKEVNEYKFKDRDLYDDTRNYAEKSDILRHNFLKDFGGVYIDLDIKCIKPLDPLHHLYEAYFGIEFPLKEWGSPIIAPGIMASVANHKIVTDILLNIRKNWKFYEEKFDNGKISKNDRIVHRLGIERSMRPVTESFFNLTTLDDNVIALPPTYFYPIKEFSIDPLVNKLTNKIKNSVVDFFIRFTNPESPNKIALWLSYRTPTSYRDVMPETFSYHDYFGENSLLKAISFNDAFGLYDLQFKLNSLKLSGRDKVKFALFEEFYKQNNYSEKAKFNLINKIPSVIHVISDNTIDKGFDNLSKIAGNNFTIKTWKNSAINNEFPEIINKISMFHNEDEKNFFLALNILKKYGGIYINHNHLKFLKSIDEFNGKYDLYAGLLPLTKNNIAITIDTNFIAAKPEHFILNKIITDIDQQQVEKFYLNNIVIKNIYKFIGIGGKNIVFPPMFFHPLTAMPEEESILAQLGRFYLGYQRAFTSANKDISIAINN